MRPADGATAELTEIEVEDDAFTHGFVQVPVAVVFDPDLSPGAKAVYGALLYYRWRLGGAPARTIIARHLGGGLRSIERYFHELESRSYISTVRLGLGKPSKCVIRSLQGRALPDMPNWHISPAKVARPSRQKGTSHHIRLDSKESITKPVDPKANRKTSRQALAEAALKRGKSVEEAVVELMRKTSTPQEEAEKIVALAVEAMGKR